MNTPNQPLDIDVTLVLDEDLWDDSPTRDYVVTRDVCLFRPRPRTTTAQMSPLEQSVLLEMCRAEK